MEFTLHRPVRISPRQCAGLHVGAGWMSIEYAGRSADGRTRYRYYIDLPAEEFTGDDLHSGCGGGTLQSGLESLLAFLGAAGEALLYSQRTGRQSENLGLFPQPVAEWAMAHSDELACLQIELEENPGLIEERK